MKNSSPQGLKAGSLKRKTAMARGSGFAASPAQQKKAREEPCIVTGFDSSRSVIDPAHLTSRAQGGCDDPLCVVSLQRYHHHLFDNGEFDLLPYLAKTRVPELCHALEHYEGNLIGLLQRLTGRRWEAA